MIATRRELVDDVLDLVGETGDDRARATANRLVNRAVERIWLRHPWRQFWMPVPTTITTVAGQRAYPLPDYFGRVGTRQGRVINTSTGTVLVPIAPDHEADVNPYGGTTLDVSGVPTHYTIGGTAGVSKQPTSAGEAVAAVSSSATDTDVIVTIEGLTAAGAYQRATVTLSGTVAVALGTFAVVLSVAKAWPDGIDITTTGTSSRGTVTIAGATSGTLHTLAAHESAREHRLFVLSPTPSSSGDVIAIPTLRAPRPLLYDSDICPDHWGPAIVEELLIQWKVSEGTFASDATIPRPAFTELVGWDQVGSMPVTERVRPWGG